MVVRSAVYTESLFAFLSFWGALSLAVGSPSRAAVAFFAASATRSNGAFWLWAMGWETSPSCLAV